MTISLAQPFLQPLVVSGPLQLLSSFAPPYHAYSRPPEVEPETDIVRPNLVASIQEDFLHHTQGILADRVEQWSRGPWNGMVREVLASRDPIKRYWAIADLLWTGDWVDHLSYIPGAQFFVGDTDIFAAERAIESSTLQAIYRQLEVEGYSVQPKSGPRIVVRCVAPYDAFQEFLGKGRQGFLIATYPNYFPSRNDGAISFYREREIDHSRYAEINLVGIRFTNAANVVFYREEAVLVLPTTSDITRGEVVSLHAHESRKIHPIGFTFSPTYLGDIEEMVSSAFYEFHDRLGHSPFLNIIPGAQMKEAEAIYFGLQRFSQEHRSKLGEILKVYPSLVDNIMTAAANLPLAQLMTSTQNLVNHVFLPFNGWDEDRTKRAIFLAEQRQVATLMREHLLPQFPNRLQMAVTKYLGYIK